MNFLLSISPEAFAHFLILFYKCCQLTVSILMLKKYNTGILKRMKVQEWQKV